MKFLFEEMNISTSNRTELIDITDKVEGFVNDSDIKNGILFGIEPTLYDGCNSKRERERINE